MIEIKELNKKYNIHHGERLLIKKLFLRNRKEKKEKGLWALKDINFTVDKGNTIGVIGENGSGKSTLLKVIAGVTTPTSGSVNVLGKVSALLELGTGFHPELTGRENIYLNGALFGLRKKDIDSKFDNIVSFAELQEFIDTPIKHYSSGMFVRLGFSLAVNIDPDILLIDEVLAVGDETFQRECIRKIKSFKELGKTILFVSHDLDKVSELCDWVLLFKDGRVIKEGIPNKVIDFYLKTVGKKKGVAILKRGSIEVIFNNGKINIYNEGKALTKDRAGYTSFLCSNQWWNSNQIDWEIEEKTENRIVVKGIRYRLGISEKWELALTEDNNLSWNIDIVLSEKKDLQYFYADFMLTDKYTNWFSPGQRGKFPLITPSDNRLSEIFSGDYLYRFMGVSVDVVYLPNIAIEFSSLNFESKPMIYNTSHSFSSRLLRILNVNTENKTSEYGICMKLIFSKADIKQYFVQRFKEELRNSGLNNEQFRFVFKYGGMKVYWEGKEITKGLGLHTTVLVSGKWYDSSQAHWELEKKSDDVFVAKGKWHRIPFIQEWSFKVDQENNILWDIRTIRTENVKVERICANIMCTDKYENYFNIEHKGDFPEISSNMKVWEAMFPAGNVGNIVGFEVKEKKDGMIPSLLLQSVGETLSCEGNVFNSDCYSQARVLQFTIGKGALNRDIQSENLFSAKIVFNELNLERYFDKEIQKIGFSYERLRLIVRQGLVRIYWDGKEITKGKGLYTSVFSPNHGKWQDSFQAEWEVNKKGEDTLIAKIKLQNISLIQIWEFKLDGENTLFWNVDVEAEDELEIREFRANLMASDQYKEWLCSEGHDKFVDSVVETDTWEYVFQRDRLSKYMGLIGLSSSEISIPPILMEFNKKELIDVSQICNAPYYKSRVLFYSATKMSRNINKKRIFSLKLTINKDLQSRMLEAEKVTYITNGESKFLFDFGRGKVFYKDKEITKELSFYTSLCGIGYGWQDSMQACWEMRKISDCHIRAKGNWNNLPISQLWDIEFMPSGVIKWSIKMKVIKKFNITREQTNLMLSDNYSEWTVIDIDNGVFPKEFMEISNTNGDLNKLWEGTVDSKVGVLGKKINNVKELPSIIFSSLLNDSKYNMVIANSDSFFKGRILQYVRNNRGEILPGEYTYFKGEIVIKSIL